LDWFISEYYLIMGKLLKVSCDGKRSFASFEMAQMVDGKRKVKDKTEVYKCKYCKQYHIGTHLISKKNVTKNIQKRARKFEEKLDETYI